MTAITYPMGAAGPARAVPGRQASLRLTARGRAVLMVLALVLVAAWSLSGTRAAAGIAEPALEVTPVTIAAGQTLWQVAATVTAPGEDVRDVVDRLVELNGLDGASLQAGQQILVPSEAGF